MQFDILTFRPLQDVDVVAAHHFHSEGPIPPVGKLGVVAFSCVRQSEVPREHEFSNLQWPAVFRCLGEGERGLALPRAVYAVLGLVVVSEIPFAWAR